MSDLEDMLSGILSDPKQMEKISSVARSLMGEELKSDSAEPVFDANILKKLGGMMRDKDGKDRQLLLAMRPYLSDKRRSKMDRAMKIARLAGMAEIAANEFGGEDDV